MKNTNWVWSVMIGLAFGAVATAQDSVGKRSCEPDAPTIDKVGDAVDPWDDGATNEQRNDYVVDLVPFQTSWNTTFGIAPIIKTSKTNEDFYGSLTSAQAISRLHRTNVPIGSGYAAWNGPGFGVNNDATKNDVPSIVDTSCLTGNQFAVMFAEFSTTDVSNSHNAIVGGVVRYVPTNPERLYVSRIMAAINGCDNNSNLSQMGLGGIDEFGTLHFRADGDTTSAPDPVAAACGLSNLLVNDLIPPAEANQNIFRVRLPQRDATKRNVISNDFVAGGQFDKGTAPPTTEWLVRNSAVTHSTPNGGPESVFGSAMLLDANFNNELVSGTTFGAISSTTTHLNAVVTNGSRGNISYTSKNCTNLASTHGMGAILGKDDPTFTQVMNVFGLGAGASITGTKALVLPADIFDNIADPGPGPSFGLSLRNAAGTNEHDHYHSQVAFRGGNGQIALGTDQAGNLLVAAHVNHPDSGGGLAHEFNYIVVAKVDCATGTTTWTMAGYNSNGNLAGNDVRIGKAILDGPAGVTIARMTTLDRVTGGAPLGPSVSAPMIDSVGNVYFVSAIQMCDSVTHICNSDPGLDDPADFTNALLRAVYDPTAFGYRLELVFKLGDVFHGKNSDRDYVVSFTGIADNNSVDSGTAWSGNISEVAHMNGSTAGLMTKDSRTLGGLVLAAEIVYDVDDDGDFDECDVSGGTDQDYNVLLYIGALDAPDCVADSECVDCDGCTRDRCLPGDSLANGVGCVNFEALYGDISPSPFGDGIVDLDDLLCLLAGFANFLDCPLSDISPCPTGEGDLVDLDDLLVLLNAFAGEPSCCDLMR